jgi:short subunit dehydrogenase-like uncharacterized protein
MRVVVTVAVSPAAVAVAVNWMAQGGAMRGQRRLIRRSAHLRDRRPQILTLRDRRQDASTHVS